MLNCYPVPGKTKSDMICRAFLAGAPRSAKGSVFFGTEGQMDAFQHAKRGPDPWYYVDNSYFDKHRGTYFRVTKNALQIAPLGRGSDGERFAKLGVEIKPWRTELGREILLVPQSDNFMKSTIGLNFDWAADTRKMLAGWGFDARTRPWTSDKVKAGTALLQDLPNIRLLITFSSASAITAMLEGVPAISTSPTAAAHWISSLFDAASVANPSRPSRRLEFAQVLADNQFTLEEFRDGKAWAWLAKN